MNVRKREKEGGKGGTDKGKRGLEEIKGGGCECIINYEAVF